MIQGTLRTGTALAVCAAAFAPVGALAADTFDTIPATLDATVLVPPALMQGPGFTVNPTATNDGYTNTYTIQSDQGEVTAVSDYRLRVRIQEIEAFRTLDAMSRSGAFGDSLVDGVMSPIEGAGKLITDPVETTSGAVEGVSRWFGDIGRAVTSDDPYQEGGLSAAAGWAATKRGYAVELNVDPYTDWEPLQQALVSVGRASFAGGITASVGMGFATSDTVLEYPVLALSLTNDMNQLLIDNPPALLTKRNREVLLKMQIDEDVTDAFLRNYNFSPMEKLMFVEALGRMDGAQGRQTLVAEGAAAPDKIVARYLQQRAEMMANFHTKHAAADIVDVAEVPFQKTRDGRLVGVFPIDFMLWNEDAATISREAHTAATNGAEMWFEGSMTPNARAGLEGLGWTVKEQVGLLTGERLQPGEAGGVVSPAARGAAVIISR